MNIEYGVVIHGGVGTLERAQLTPELEAEYRGTLEASLHAGHAALKAGNALDAVEAAVRVMEDSPLFNAGRGSNFDERGIVAMDASIMDGDTLEAGAVAGVTDVRYPVTLSRRVMDASDHVLLIGEGAEAFARAQGIPVADPAFFFVQRRWDELERARAERGGRPNVLSAPGRSADPKQNSGTVGAVALDRDGRIASATSTGGMANKTFGRVGDTPIIGAGTYAGASCAISCTGWGEYFITHAVAYDVHARMEYRGISLAQAAHEVVMEKLEASMPGAGGLIGIDRSGAVEMCYSTEGMYRGWIGPDGSAWTGIFED